MVNLKDLIIKGCWRLNGMPRGLRALSNLQTLSLFVAPKRNDEHYKEYGALEELCGLNSLRGQLEVRNLGQVDNARRANSLEKMEFLRFLKLCWDDNHENGSGTDRFNEVLDSLKPHPHLKRVVIENFMGVRLSSWLSSVMNLTSIALSRCKRCQYIPPLDKLPSLKTLLLESLDDLEYISEEASNSFSSTSSRGFFPSLERLKLLDCRKLKGWWRRDDDDDAAINEKLPSFACLSILEIKDCPNLTSMPLYPSIEEVTLHHASGKALQPMMMLVNSVGPSTSSNFSAPLSNLKSLCLLFIDDLEYMSEKAGNSCSSTPSRTFFPSLKRLELSYCRKLKGWWRRDDDDGRAINEKLPSFACLSILKITDCPNLTSMPLYPSIEEVSLCYASGKALQPTMMMVNSVRPSTTSSFSAPLSDLKSLCLSSIDDLEYMSEKADNICSSTPSSPFFPSLKRLKLRYCGKLKGWWRRDDDDDDGAINEKLPSFACLSILEIKACPNLTSMPLYPSIEEVTLEETSWKALQPTMMLVNGVGPSTSSSFSAPLSNLKSLCLNSIDDLEYVSEKAGNSCSSTPSRTFFPSLKELSLERCYKLRGWWRRDDGDDDDGATTRITELPSFACLSKLKIRDCPHLTSMPLYPSLEELYWEGTSSKPFQKTMMMKNSTAGPSTSFSFSSPLFKLKSLEMREIDDLECLPEDGLRNLSSLVDMEVVSCPRLTQLSQGIRFLTSLQKLTISDCEELECLVNDEDNDDMKWHQFATTLQRLEVCDCKNFKALPKWMCNSTLRSLNLSGLPKLVSLPKRLQFLTLHSDLSIKRCENLKALPDSICNLKSLRIDGCPQLSENCGDNKGNDWPKIAHIPMIKIDGKCIQGRDPSDDLHTLKLSVFKKRTTCSTCFHRLIGVDVRPSTSSSASTSWSLQSL